MKQIKFVLFLYILFVVVLINASILVIWHFHKASAAPVLMSPQMSQPQTIAANPDGRIEDFVVGSDGSIYHVWQHTSSVWTGSNGWANMGTPAGRDFKGMYNGFTVGNDVAGNLIVVANTSQGDVWYNQINGSGTSLAWSGWTALGTPSNVTFLKQPVIQQNADGRLEIFEIGSDNLVYHIWQTSSGWSNWASMPNLSSPVSLTLNSLTVSRNADGRLEIAVSASDGNVYHTFQFATTGITWSNWVNLGDPGKSITMHNITMAASSNGTLTILGVGSDGMLYAISQYSQGKSGWSNWISIANAGSGAAAYKISTAYDAAGTKNLELFLVTSDGKVSASMQQGSPNYQWTPLSSSLGYTSSGNYTGDLPHVAIDGNHAVNMFLYDNTAGEYVQTKQSASTQLSGWYAVSNFGYPVK